MLQPLGKALEQGHRVHEQVVEVHGVHLHELALVEVVHLRSGLGEEAADLLSVGGGVLQLVLGVRDDPCHGLRREAFDVQVELAQTALDQAAAVVLVVDRERGRVAQTLGLAPQDASAHGVEGADPHGARHGTDERLDARLHLAGGLVREGDGQDLVRPHAVHTDEIGHAMGQHAGLARTGAGQDEQGTFEVLHGPALLGVEIAQQRVERLRRRRRRRRPPPLGRLAGTAARLGRPGFLGRPGRLGAHYLTPLPMSQLKPSATRPAATSLTPE